MQYPILRQKEVAEALWAYRDAVMEEARSEMRVEAFLNETSAASITEQEMYADGERAKAGVKAAYDALETALQAALRQL
jgi:hypothetical protein